MRVQSSFPLKSGILPDFVCFSHLRWDFVFQRPQHLLSRCAREHRVFFVEEPVFENDRSKATIELKEGSGGVRVIVPRLPAGLGASRTVNVLRRLLKQLFRACRIRECIAWYYTPMALPFTIDIDPILVVYDCMDELSAFRGAPPELKANEEKLMSQADIVFTGGISLYEARAKQHRNIHPFPSSIDVAHFARARDPVEIPADELRIPPPRLGFAGVIDERMDLQLVREIASLRPGWSIILIGPVAKLAENELPRGPNIHYLGPRPYSLLPQYMAGWEIGIMPFARNESTRFISPTKTPEYLAAGKPVVSTSIRDVVRIYGKQKVVAIADSSHDFVSQVERILQRRNDPGWLERVDSLLSRNSWDATWTSMMRLIKKALAERTEQRRPERAITPAWQGTVAGENDV